MASFITRLVERTLAESPALAPRLAGRYEARREAMHSPLPPEVQYPRGIAQDVQGPARQRTEAPAPTAPAERDARAQGAPVFDAGGRGHEPEGTPPLVGRVATETPEPRLVQQPDAPPSARTFPDG